MNSLQLPFKKVRRMKRTTYGILSSGVCIVILEVGLLEVGVGVCSFHRKFLGLSSGGHVSKMDSEKDDKISVHCPKVQNVDFAEKT